MELWADLLTTWIGVLSLIVILISAIIPITIAIMFIRKSAKKRSQAEDQDKGGIPGSHQHPSH
ncbi:DUF3149 domain-containing protein [Alkalilimnicola ehrlichii]|uniref:DUF3149 domain-containing protein n=1 Tax=Alkalilimnicola ehrlichii TaxID=351052 RepID=UPI003B9F12EF